MTPRGLAMLKKAEGCRLAAYRDGGGIWTIGYGHCGRDVHDGLVIGMSEAEELLEKDVAAAAAAVDRLVHVPLTSGQRDALTSFVFNCGVKALESSELLRELNAGRYDAVPDQLRRWTHDGGHVVPGLVNRREAEIALWSES